MDNKTENLKKLAESVIQEGKKLHSIINNLPDTEDSSSVTFDFTVEIAKLIDTYNRIEGISMKYGAKPDPDDEIHIQETFAPLEGSECDPTGKDPHSPGAKLDSGKPLVEDILGGFPNALMQIAKVGTFGANKYTLNGWKEVDNGISRYRNAAGRHRLYAQIGEDIDPDSGLLHIAHEAWNILAALELKLEEEYGDE